MACRGEKPSGSLAEAGPPSKERLNAICLSVSARTTYGRNPVTAREPHPAFHRPLGTLPYAHRSACVRCPSPSFHAPKESGEAGWSGGSVAFSTPLPRAQEAQWHRFDSQTSGLTGSPWPSNVWNQFQGFPSNFSGLSGKSSKGAGGEGS